MKEECKNNNRQLRHHCQVWLRTAVEDVGITQAELGRRVGLNRLQMSQLLSGKRRWDKQIILNLSDTLRVPPPEIVSEMSDDALI